MTVSKLAKAMAMGAGCGRHEAYQPWIRVRRRLSSPVSNLHRFRVPQYVRPLHLLSGLEQITADVIAWLGFAEVREQFPLWPYPHRHPLHGTHRDFDRKRPATRGLLSLCKDAGISHGVFPGSRIPFVATIDFAVTLGRLDAERLVLMSCKPYAVLKGAPNRVRMLERIKMEQLYAHEIGAHHVVVDGTLFSEVLQRQLGWFRPLKEEVDFFAQSNLLHDYAQALMSVAEERTLAEARTHAAAMCRLHDHDLAETCYRAAGWKGLIDIDLSKEIQVWKPLRRDFGKFKSHLRTELFGASA